ncbi:hypothetical protein RDI58_001074 [Solanum bulbocastanum]|uniref:Uncharacterized protein n=1 Tax=Solanum bulbocastanum TaxID=147425 RepID=A0AAN8UBV3_SOLBU
MISLGGNSRPLATQPPTKASAQWFYPSIQAAKAMVESMCSFFHEPWRLSDLRWYVQKHDKRLSWIHEDIWKKLNEYWASPDLKKKYTVAKETQTSVLPRSSQYSDQED